MKSIYFLGFFLAFGIIFKPVNMVAQCPPSGNTYVAVAGGNQQTLDIANGDEIWFQWPAGSTSATVSMFPSASVNYYLYDGVNNALLANGTCGGAYFTYNCGTVAPGYFVRFRACGIPAGQTFNFVFVEALSGGPLALKDNNLRATATEGGIQLTYYPTAGSISIIFRSSNGRDFEEIGQTSEATFLDSNPLDGSNYYRVSSDGDQSKIANCYWTNSGPLRITSANPAPVGTTVMVNTESANIEFVDISGRVVSNPGAGIFCTWVVVDDLKYFVGRQIFQ